MSKCKWCEKEFEKHVEYYPNVTYCNYDCRRMYETYGMRKIIFDFAISMEEEMQNKDKLGYENKSRTIDYLKEKLKEERKEVDECFIQAHTFFNPTSNYWIAKFINEESLHEGIMLVLLRYRLKEEQKG